MTTTEKAVARENLCRSVPFTLTRADGDGDDDGLTIEGYGAVFNQATRIDSWEGCFDEVIAPGAFRKSLRERSPKMQFDHGHHPLLGSLPLGRWDVAEEDSQGLHVVGRMSDNWLVEPFRDAIRDGGVEGMSFRFSVVREEWRDKDNKVIQPDQLLELLWTGGGDRGPITRTLKEVKVPEVGPVVWPAYEQTSVGVRSQVVTIDFGKLAEPETRRTLAQAVICAEEANRSTEDDAPHADQEPPVDHPPEASGAPVADRSSPGEHPSALPKPKGNPAREYAQNARGYLLSLERNNRNGGQG